MGMTPGENHPPTTQPDHDGSTERLILRLYVAESAPNSEQAESNLRDLLQPLPDEAYALEVVDCLREPLRALHDGVIVTPMLLRLQPEPVRRIVGTLRDRDSVAGALGIPLAGRAERGDA